jgi:RNA-directed DNA polymerase
VKPRLQGTRYEMRFTNGAVRCFQFREDSEEAMEVSAKRFVKYGLTPHPEKTRPVAFGQYAEEHLKRQGKKPATFHYLGCTHPAHTAKQKRF